MKPVSSDLPVIWGAHDNSRLVAKQISVRLPVHVAAKLFALEGIYRNRTRTQIIGDLLDCAIRDVEKNLPSERGERLGPGPDDKNAYEDVGLRGRYFHLANKHLKELEKQLGNSTFVPFLDSIVIDD